MVCGVLNVVRMNNQRSKCMKQVLLNLFVCGAIILCCISGLAVGVTKYPLPSDEVIVIKTFFKVFTKAFNDGNSEKIKEISGNNWGDWSRNIERGVKIENIQILDVLTNGATNVVAKVIAVEANGKRSSPEIVFTLIKREGTYFIEKIAVPEVDKRNKELRAAVGVVEKLILAINAQDMEAVKAILSFGDVPGFETELSPRGLSWITNAVQNQIKVPRRGSGVSRGNRRSPLQGRVCVPSSTGGTNILEQFYFKDGKIDRAVPRRETKEEFLKRVAAENAAARKQWEAREAAEQKKIEEQFREWIRKQKKRDGEGAK